MSLDSWNWFIKLAENESFTKAAESLQISQQTLSARLVALEKNIGAKLVVRGTPLSLTQAGMVFLVYAREQRQSQEDMLRQIGEVTGSGAGEFKLGISHVRSQALVPHIVRAMTSALPGVSVHVVEATNRELIYMAERAEVDAVVARFEGSLPGVRISSLYQEEIVLAVREDVLEEAMGVSAKDAVASIEEKGVSLLSECPFVLGRVDDIAGRVAYSELRNAGIRPRVVATSENMATLLAMAAEGLGAVFCPVNVLNAFRGSTGGLLRIPLSAHARYDISLGVPVQAEQWDTLAVFKEALAESVRQEQEALA